MKELLFKQICKNITSLCQEKRFKDTFPKEYDEICNMVFPEGFKFPQKLYHYVYDDSNLELGICPVCGNRCNFMKFGSGYHMYCSRKCLQNSEETKRKKEMTTLKKYGVKCSLQSDVVKNKSKETILQKYGVDNVMKSKLIQEKSIKTNLEKRGVPYSMQDKSVVQKSVQTNLKKRGVRNPSMDKEVIHKRKLTRLRNNDGKWNSEDTLKKIQTTWSNKSESEKEIIHINHINGWNKLTDYEKKESCDKMWESKKKNNTTNTSSIEINFENWLNINNIKYRRNYKDDIRYPFHIDFYLIEYDLFIEIQGHWTHGPHPFNENSEEDINKLSIWTEKSKHSNFYKSAISIWTKVDVNKRNIALKNKLKYIEIFSTKLIDVINEVKRMM